MDTYTLTAASPTSEAFEVNGSCYICAKGSGVIKIERRVGEEFEILTNERGEAMAFVGDGVLFNNSITCSKAIKHRFTAETDKEITVSIVRGRK